MKWNRFTIKTKTEAEDVIISALADVGVEGVEIQDKQPLTETDKEQMFVDIMPEGPADDGIAYLNFYLEEDTETAPVLERVRAVLEEVRGYMDIGEGTITESQTEDKDWINNWKEYFHQFYVDDILIVPSWEEVKEEEGDRSLDGMVFVITGSVEHFANRKELQTLIESKGGKATGSVTSKTTYLINNDVNSTSSKNKKARELGIPILSEEDFLKFLEGEKHAD
mgnify:CR=1 FL=1